jgi:hypothetical protein
MNKPPWEPVARDETTQAKRPSSGPLRAAAAKCCKFLGRRLMERLTKAMLNFGRLLLGVCMGPMGHVKSLHFGHKNVKSKSPQIQHHFSSAASRAIVLKI